MTAGRPVYIGTKNRPPTRPAASGETLLSGDSGLFEAVAPWRDAVRRRIAQIDLARLRSESFVGSHPSPGPVERPEPSTAPGSAARDLVIRTLGVLGDTVSIDLLASCSAAPRSTPYLAGIMTLPLSAVWERVNDLIQVGLLERSLDDDRVVVTPAGCTVLEILVAVTTSDGTER
ncbi:MAG: hypothetical protein ACYDGN_02435 [Acidimicrobiales bacterium]